MMRVTVYVLYVLLILEDGRQYVDAVREYTNSRDCWHIAQAVEERLPLRPEISHVRAACVPLTKV